MFNRTIDCHIIRGNTSKSQQDHFWPNFAHNVSFSGKLGNFPEFLFSENGSFWYVELWNRTEKLGNFPEILFSQNGSVWYVDLWNRTVILINCHIIRG